MKVRFGIIGLGDIANRFAKVLTGMDDATLLAVASRDMARSEAFALKYSAARAYDSYEALMKDTDVDIIYIALTHNFHYEVIKKCLELGKAVICEKPMVLTEAHAKELTELATKKGLLLMEAMWSRCLPVFRKAREWVEEGRIGKPSFVNASFAFSVPFMPEHRLFNPDLAGGSLYDAGVYPIEFALGILGEVPDQIRATGSRCATGADDFVSMSLGFESGAQAGLSCGLKATTSMDGVIYGDKGKVIVYGFLGSKRCELFDEKGESVEVFEDEFEDGFIYEIREAARLFRKGKTESLLIPHRDTIACARIFDSVMGQI